MNIATIILISLNILGLGIAIGKDGQPQGNYSGGITLISFITAMILYHFAGLF